MFNLFILNENFSGGIIHNLLNIISVVSIICGIFVIISKNPIVSVLFLIGLFLTIASYLMILGINFIGLSYLLVYVGAVSILFLFILMLINVRVSELVTDNRNSIPLAIITGIFFNMTFYYIIPSSITININKYLSILAGKMPLNTDLIVFNEKDIDNITNDDVLYVTSHTWDSMLSETSHITTIGNIIYTSYPLLLLITSIILLLSMVGAIVITIKQ